MEKTTSTTSVTELIKQQKYILSDLNNVTVFVSVDYNSFLAMRSLVEKAGFSFDTIGGDMSYMITIFATTAKVTKAVEQYAGVPSELHTYWLSLVDANNQPVDQSTEGNPMNIQRAKQIVLELARANTAHGTDAPYEVIAEQQQALALVENMPGQPVYVAVSVEHGMVQSVRASTSGVHVMILDFDSQEESEDDPANRLFDHWDSTPGMENFVPEVDQDYTNKVFGLEPTPTLKETP